jgi:hypothetical protein
MADVEEKGLDILAPFKKGDYARPRLFEVAAAINRMRTLKIKKVSGAVRLSSRRSPLPRGEGETNFGRSD